MHEPEPEPLVELSLKPRSIPPGDGQQAEGETTQGGSGFNTDVKGPNLYPMLAAPCKREEQTMGLNGKEASTQEILQSYV